MFSVRETRTTVQMCEIWRIMSWGSCVSPCLSQGPPNICVKQFRPQTAMFPFSSTWQSPVLSVQICCTYVMTFLTRLQSVEQSIVLSSTSGTLNGSIRSAFQRLTPPLFIRIPTPAALTAPVKNPIRDAIAVYQPWAWSGYGQRKSSLGWTYFILQ